MHSVLLTIYDLSDMNQAFKQTASGSWYCEPMRCV
jgi:hypothetical protein